MNNQIRQYKIIEQLGEGGMGEVYRAEDTRLQRHVALKLLASKFNHDDSIRNRFLREARAASAINHPNVCMIYDIGETEDGRPFLALELIEGFNLADLLGERRFEVQEVVEIAIQIGEALLAAHAKGIVHRDIKPANINVDAQNHVKVIDFGLAKQMDIDDAKFQETSEIVTDAGMVVGTPAYMSPEQAMGKPIDERSDLFSLGSVIYHLLTQQPPFAGANMGELLHNVLHRQPDAIARLNYDVPPELERIVLKLLAKDVARRYQTARDLSVDLHNLKRDLENATERQDSNSIIGSTSLGQVNASDSDSSIIAKPEELSQSDVVISYADLDDQPVTSGHQGWITKLHENLQVRVAQLSGKQVAVVKQPDPSESKDVEAEVLRQVPKAKTVVSVLSPPFAKSAGCHRLVEAFRKCAEDSGIFEVDNRSRLLNVVKTPVDETEIPPACQGLVPYEFYDRDPESGRLREFDEAFGDLAQQRFHERVYDVAYDVSQVLKYLGEDQPPTGQRTNHPKTVFLAATTSDLEPHRDQLRRELVEMGHDVLPKQPLPLVATELVNVVQSCLEKSDLAIHFVGEHFGFVPEATELSVVALQNQVAAQLSNASGLKRLVWVPKGLRPKDERQEQFIQQLESKPDALAGAELIADTMENLKVLLISRWEREQVETQNSNTAEEPSTAPRVYIICDQRDEEAIEPLEDFFYEKGIEVSLPGFEADESEVQQIHIQNLRDCDAALIYYGAAGMHWVDFKIRDLQKAAGYRDSRPIPVNAVYLGPPFNRRKERFKSVSVETLRQDDNVFNASVLAGFVDSLYATRGNN